MNEKDVIAIFEAELIASLSDTEIRGFFGKPESWAVLDRARRRVARAKAEKAVEALIAACINGANQSRVYWGSVDGAPVKRRNGGLSIEGFGWVAKQVITRAEEWFWNNETGEPIFDGDGMFKRFDPLPDGYYCWAPPWVGYVDAFNPNPVYVEIWHWLKGVGFFTPWWAMGFQEFDSLLYGPVKFDDLAGKVPGFLSIRAPWPIYSDGVISGETVTTFEAFQLNARKVYGTWERYDFATLSADGMHERAPGVESEIVSQGAGVTFQPAAAFMAYLNDWVSGGEEIAGGE